VAQGDLSEIRATRPATSRMRSVLTWLAAPLRPFMVVLFPDRHLPREVVAGRYGLPLLSVVLCACVAAFALGTRLDVGPAVRADNAAEMEKQKAKGDAKQVELKTDREIDDEIAQRTAVERVKLGLGAVLLTPLRVLALGLVLLLFGRYIGGKPTMPRTLTVAALAAVPGAARALLTALIAWRQPRVFPDELGSLLRMPQVIPDGHPVLARLFSGVDVFTVWSVVVIAVGFGAAAELKARKSIVAIAIGFALYLVVTGHIMGAGR
jgi:hypothetical protein